MLKHPTLDQLHTLGLYGMAKAFADLSAGAQANPASTMITLSAGMWAKTPSSTTGRPHGGGTNA